MTTENTMFDGATTPEVKAPETAESQSLLEALVGDKQKYKTSDELAKAYVHADEFIQRLKAENAQLREQVQKSRTLDEVLEQLKATPAAAETPSTAQTLTPESIASIVEQQLTGLETRRTQETNLKKADALMKEKFGDKAKEVFDKAATSPTHKKVLTELAAVDPDKFVALFVTKAPETPEMDSGTVNTTGAATSTTNNDKAWSAGWVRNVRKNDPNKYWSAEFQYQLQQKVAANPSLYFG